MLNAPKSLQKFTGYFHVDYPTSELSVLLTDRKTVLSYAMNNSCDWIVDSQTVDQPPKQANPLPCFQAEQWQDKRLQLDGWIKGRVVAGFARWGGSSGTQQMRW